MTYTLVDHKWVCFADCCRIGATGPGGPLNMHRQRRDTPLLYTPSIYIRSIICTVPIRERCWRNLSPGQVSTALLRCKRSSFDSRNSKLDWAADNAAIRRAKPVRQSNRVDPRYIKRKKYELICKIMAPATSPAFIKVTQVYRAARNSMEITLARDSFSPSLPHLSVY